jgi:hypothetical protein
MDIEDAGEEIEKIIFECENVFQTSTSWVAIYELQISVSSPTVQQTRIANSGNVSRLLGWSTYNSHGTDNLSSTVCFIL